MFDVRPTRLPLRLPGLVPPGSQVPTYDPGQMASLPSSIVETAAMTDLGGLVIDDCLNLLRQVPDHTFDLVLTSPP